MHLAEHHHNLVPSSVAIPSTVKDDSLVSHAIPSSQLGLGGPDVAGIPPVNPLVGAAPLQVSPPALAPADSGTSRHIFSGSKLIGSSPASPLEGSDLDDDDVTMFLNLENEDDAQLSSESTKKRRLEEGDVSSPSQPAI